MAASEALSWAMIWNRGAGMTWSVVDSVRCAPKTCTVGHTSEFSTATCIFDVDPSLRDYSGWLATRGLRCHDPTSNCQLPSTPS